MAYRGNLVHIFSRVGTCLAAGSLFKVFKPKKSCDGQDLQTDSFQSSESKRRITLDGYELKMVQILIRHGARTPLHLIETIEEVPYNKDLLTRTLPYTDFGYETLYIKGGPRPISTYDQRYANKILKGGAVYGVLTTTGQEQSYVLGLLLKKQYITEAGFIDDIFNPNQVHVRSTNCSRTIDTARCVLAGMFGRKHLNKLLEPLRIHVDVFNVDPLIPRTATCHVLHRINRAARIHGADLPELKEDRRVIEKLFGLDPSKKVNFVDMHDDIVVRETHGFSIPRSLLPYKDMVIKNAIQLKYFAFCGQHKAERGVATTLSAGPLVTMLMENLEKADENSPRLYIFACHDSTLVALLGGLGLFDDVWPPFTADVRFELYENQEKQKFVRISYNGEDKVMNGASSELCPLDDFKAAVSSLLIKDREYWELCDSDILEQIAKELVEAEKDDSQETEDEETSDIPAGM